MKVSQIIIKDFHQFKDLTIDLTYPKGHAKEGQPLDKVCFIGQSGTGKTSLLELIPKFLSNYDTPLIIKSGRKSIERRIRVQTSFGLNNEYQMDTAFVESATEGLIERKSAHHKHNNEPIDPKSIIDYYQTKWISDISTKVIYFPANLNYDIEEAIESTINDKVIIDFSADKVSSIWSLILEKIQKYQEQELQIRQGISKTVEQASNNLDVIKLALKKLEDWK
ncbi:MAG: AAA family ATPase, partial [Taibaiella sp.]|nr:AAA family ATPase [Taibaiella sp.]